MEVAVNNRSPREDVELEDGEICDDDAEECVPVRRPRDGRRPGPNRGAGPRARKLRQLPLLPPPDFRLRLPYSLPRHGHGPGPGPGPGPFPNGSDRPPSPPRPPLLPPGLVPLGEPSPRSSFWERSHGALGRFRHRVMPNAGRGWRNRGGRGPLSRFSLGDCHGFKTESPPRKPKPSGRNHQIQVRKVPHKVEDSVDESFEDLLSKYRQIQLELECIRKEETMALEPSPGAVKEGAPDKVQSSTGARAESDDVPSSIGLEEPSQMEPMEMKAFQAFNIKPLRQKLHQPTPLDPLKPRKDDGDVGKQALRQEEEEQKRADGEETAMCVCCNEEAPALEENRQKNSCSVCRESSASSEDSACSPEKAPVSRVEEEELSELQLRLLALQSASKKWQQKEQQVLKKSQDRITRAAPDRKPTAATAVISPTPAGASSNRQRVATRSTSSAAASPAERPKTRSKNVDGDRDLTKAGQRPSDREREKDRPKQSPKAGAEKGRAVGKTHPAKKAAGSGAPVTKQAFRKQQLRTWKLQQQRHLEEKRRHDEERRHREDEIRRIRDLSNQDEQYNRFMKLVGGARARTRSKSRDSDHRKSGGKPGLDTSGNLYQYDNYEEVAMDTDSETGSPVASPPHGSFPPECPGYLGVPQTPLYGSDPLALGLPFLPSDIATAAPPPPPLPPPPELLEAPPKPPFADEEEEEEMLLRETCLMSMANKRGVPSEDKTSSGPASPCGPASPSLDVLPPSRGNLSTVSLNTVSQPRVNRFPRGGHNARLPLVLPRHKSVVISLNDSDDSDSDMDACGTPQSVFRGLESMIKDARRTVEASKTKAATGSEKENNPFRTSDLQLEVQKAELHQLRVDTSREKQKSTTTLTRDLAMWSSAPSVQSSTSSVTPGSTVEPSRRITMEKKLLEAEQKLQKNRELLQKDEAVLRHLLQQETKKRESLKNAEAKMSKLREQLQASEKIVTANRTLLKKLQEQVQRVEHRVSVKKTLASKLEEEVFQAQLLTGSGTKRRTDAVQAMVKKRQRIDTTNPSTGIDPKRHFAELMIQKQRLQQLESEYALKIQRLKEAQALLQSEPPRDLPPSEPEAQVPPPSPSFPVPQPSLHDLTQDKLTLDSEDVAEVDDTEVEPAAAKRGPRRLSLHQSSSFTKPNLEGSLPVKEASKPTKMSPTSLVPAETFAGLDLDTLKLRYKQQATLGQILQKELLRMEENKQELTDCQVKMSLELDWTTKQSGNADLKPVPFARYHSPLLVFRSYRFSPYYRTKEKLSLSSVTYSNVIQPMKFFCRFDLTGTCNDDDCGWQHMRNCSLTGDQLFRDLLSYDLSLIGCSETSSEEAVGTATETYMKKLFGTNKDRMGVDQKAVLLVSKVNESKRHVPPFTTCKEACRWRPKLGGQSAVSGETEAEQETSSEKVKPEEHGMNPVGNTSPDVCVITSEDKRYFVSETDDISNLESSVLENPGDTQLWIKLAFKYLESSLGDSLEAALNTLSRALENNCDDPEIWTHYLLLFSRRGSREEVQEMCEMAVEHAPDQRIWWNYLTLETTFEGKDYVCERLLQFLVAEASSGVTDQQSFHLMEALLYRVELNLFTGRRESALAHFQNALKSPDQHCIADHLTTRDLALVWLSYIHLTEFDRMPSSLFDPAESGPSRLVSTEIFLLPWTTQDIQKCPDTLNTLFQDAISQCSSRSLSAPERVRASLPLYLNLVHLNKLLNKYDEGISLCESLLQLCPDSRPLSDALVDLHLRRGDKDQAAAVWLQAVSRCPDNAEVFYGCCRFLVAQEEGESVASLFREFVLGECEDQSSQESAVDVLRHILGFPTEQLMPGLVNKKGALLQQRAYLHLIHCQWQWLHGSVDVAVDAFERALGSDLTTDQLHTLWMDYLSFSSSHLTRSTAHGRFKAFSDLVRRCLITVPTRLEVPFNPAQFWNCYSFHNKVIRFYLRLLPQSQHALLLERLRPAMTNNIELNLRLLHKELQEGNLQQVKFSTRALTNNVPRNLSAWKLAIAVEAELHQTSEVRLLYQQALKLLPLCAELWTHRLLFEAAECAPAERLKRLVDQCEQAGVSLAGGAQRDDG